MAKILNVVVIIVAGVMLADLVANPNGTGTIINGVTNLWSTSTSALLGK
jgi:hypothetical protein